MANTATWVDEPYAALLAKHANRDLDMDFTVTGNRTDLARLRQSPICLAVEQWSYGFGVKKKGTAVTVLSASTGDWKGGLMVSWAFFDKNGRYAGPEHRPPDVIVMLTKHSVIRMFERLRTNDMVDVARLVRTFCNSSKWVDTGDGNIKVVTPEGTFYGVAGLSWEEREQTAVPCLTVKTFIANKK